IAGLVSTVAGHGYITDPAPRMPGDAMKAACGQQMYNNQAADNYGNVQGELQVANGQSDFNAAECNVWQCKGYKFDDNAANVQSFTAGQVVPITVDIRAPHTGTANVSIVKTSSNSVIGQALKSWDVYASNSATIPDDNKNFDITIPSDLGSECSTAGDCVIQWFWDARSIDQTYEACVDFTVGGSGDSTPVSSAVPVSSAALASSA
ncbi:chitin binding domain-containing protein, partial [Lophiotrema nucula]